jgi:hypothetical protein
MAVEPSAQISSSIDLGLASGVPELYQKPEDRSLYQLIVQTAQNILSSIETYCGLTQKPMTQWSLLSPSATLRRQNLGRLYCISGEAIVYGALVNLYNNAGVLTARNANSSTGRSAHGYCAVNNTQQSGMNVGEYGEVILGQGILPVTGVSPADRMFLAPVNGQMQIGPDLAAGHIEQFIGIGIATNLVYIDITMGSWIQH